MFNSKIVKQINEYRIEILSALTAILGIVLVINSHNIQSAFLSYVLFASSIFIFSFRRQYHKSWIRTVILFMLLTLLGLGISFVFAFIHNSNIFRFAFALILYSVFITILFISYLYLYVLRERYYVHKYKKWEEESKRAAAEYLARENAKKEASKKWWEEDDIQRPFIRAQEELNLARKEVIESGKFVPEAIELFNQAQIEMMDRNYAKALTLARDARMLMKEGKN